MTREQFDLSVMLVGGALATLVGFGKISLGADTENMRKRVRMLRFLGPPLMVLTAVLLAATFVR